jgi:NAD(P)-dependent dehydrogenase (short-subunit alcohol dehydrogenase family)
MSVVVVTGASSGLGLSTAIEIAKLGHEVFATSRSDAGAAVIQAAADELAASSGVGSLTQADLEVTNNQSIFELIERVLSTAGTIDVLVNNAGVAPQAAVERMTDLESRQVFEANFFGPLCLIRAVLPTMRAQSSGAIVNVASLLGPIPAPTRGVYAASKSALIALSEALAIEVDQFGIRVGTVLPSIYPTKILDPDPNAFSDGPYAAIEQAFRERVRARMIPDADPIEVAEAVIKIAFGDSPPVHEAAGATAATVLAGWIEETTARVRTTASELGLGASPGV